MTVGQAKRQCLDKRPYDSRNEARDVAAKMHKQRPDWNPQHPYRCTICGGWHLTTSQERANPMPALEKKPNHRKNQPS